jgi:hypothetical protein
MFLLQRFVATQIKEEKLLYYAFKTSYFLGRKLKDGKILTYQPAFP